MNNSIMDEMILLYAATHTMDEVKEAIKRMDDLSKGLNECYHDSTFGSWDERADKFWGPSCIADNMCNKLIYAHIALKKMQPPFDPD